MAFSLVDNKLTNNYPVNKIAISDEPLQPPINTKNNCNTPNIDFNISNPFKGLFDGINNPFRNLHSPFGSIDFGSFSNPFKDIKNPFSGLGSGVSCNNFKKLFTNAARQIDEDGFKKDGLSDITMAKIDGLKRSGTTNPLDCIMIGDLCSKGGSLSYKSLLNNMNKIDCSNPLGGLDLNLMDLKLLEALTRLAICADSEDQATTKTIDDIENVFKKSDLGISKKMALGTALASGVTSKGKLDMGTVAESVINDDVKTVLKNALYKDSKNIGDKLAVNNSIFKGSNKDNVINNSLSFSNKLDITKTKNRQPNDIIKLANSASKDSIIAVTDVNNTTTSLTPGQSLSLFAKAKNNYSEIKNDLAIMFA